MTTHTNARLKIEKTIKPVSVCAHECEPKNTKSELTCKLTTPELKRRKETVIKNLKSKLLKKKELKNGYSYKFRGTDEIVDELCEFVKMERACCGFFIFNLSVSGDKSEVWLKIEGPKGVKEFISTELEM